MLYNFIMRLNRPPISPFILTANSSNINANFGDSLVLTANASSTTGPSPTGNIVVTNASTGTTIGTITVGGTSNLTTSLLPPGINTLSFSYSGDANYPATTTNITQTVLTSIYVTNSSTTATLTGKLNMESNTQIFIPGRVLVYSPTTKAMSFTGNSNCTARYIASVGTYTATSNVTLSPTPVTLATPTPGDVLSTLPVPSVTGNATAANSTSGTTVTINPGIYTQIRVSGANSTIIMNPGVYVIAGGGLSVTTGGRLIGTNVTIYNASTAYPGTTGTSGSITLNTTGNVTLTACNTGTYAGMLIFQQRTNGATITLVPSANSIISGVVYAINATYSLSGSGRLRTSSVVNQINMTSAVKILGDASGLF